MVEPDIMVICDKPKIGIQGCKGAPDPVIEILFPSNIRHDRIKKFRKYPAAGAREYWVVDPGNRAVEVHVLQNGGCHTMVYDESAEVPVLPGCGIRLPEIFPAPKTPQER
jgi:Uma2 family endonuclease